MNVKNAGLHNESKIKTLSSLEHIRLRPGMYIERLGDGSHPEDGIYVLLKEVIDNSIDEYIMGAGKRIDVKIKDRRISVRDYGRGIPTGKLVECVSAMNSGGKYNDDVFQFSVGLNGVGIKAVNALSSEFTVRSVRDGRFHEATFNSGVLTGNKKGNSDEKNGTLVSFIPDPALFPNYTFQMEYIAKRMWMYAYLNSGLSLYLNSKRYYSRNGLKDLIEAEIGKDKMYDIIALKGKMLEFAFCHSDKQSNKYFSFVNGKYTDKGGKHLSAFREGVLKSVNDFSSKKYHSADVCCGFVGAVAVKMKDPIFYSQSKDKLGNPDIRGWIVNAVRDAVVDYLQNHIAQADILMEKIERTRNHIEVQKL